jgi:hypothetical protein
MARIAGRNGRVYLDLTGSGSATALPFIAKWSMSAATTQLEVTAMDDTTKVYISDMPDASGDFSGFYDDASAQTYTAAIDGLPRKFYLYPNKTTASQYWFGTVNVDFAVNGGVGEAVAIQAKWSAATSIQKVG